VKLFILSQASRHIQFVLEEKAVVNFVRHHGAEPLGQFAQKGAEESRRE
jgi:hypothetical protein